MPAPDSPKSTGAIIVGARATKRLTNRPASWARKNPNASEKPRRYAPNSSGKTGCARSAPQLWAARLAPRPTTARRHWVLAKQNRRKENEAYCLHNACHRYHPVPLQCDGQLHRDDRPVLQQDCQRRCSRQRVQPVSITHSTDPTTLAPAQPATSSVYNVRRCRATPRGCRNPSPGRTPHESSTEPALLHSYRTPRAGRDGR